MSTESFESSSPAPVLVAGVPRSATTWTATLLAAACGQGGLIEPDNHHHQPLSMVAKRGLGSFPVLRPEDDAPAFADHWRQVFAGIWPLNQDTASLAADRLLAGMDRDRRDDALLALGADEGLFAALSGLLAGHRAEPAREVQRVVKSVQMCLALDWFAALMPRVRIVVVERHPLDVTASWMRQYASDLGPPAQGWQAKLELVGGIPPQPHDGAALVERIAWKVCLLQTAQRAAAERINCHVLTHEALCADAEGVLADLTAALDLPHPLAAVAKARETDRPGSGYETNRVRAGLPGSARRHLTDADAELAQSVIDAFAAAIAPTWV